MKLSARTASFIAQPVKRQDLLETGLADYLIETGK